MVMEESKVKCEFCGEEVNGRVGEVICFYHGQSLEKRCPYKKQPEIEQEFYPPPPVVNKPPSLFPDEPVSLSLFTVTRPLNLRAIMIFLSIVVILLLVGSGVLAVYTVQFHSQILSQNSNISTQLATIQAQSTVIQSEQTAQHNFQATWAAIAMNNSLGTLFVTQSPSPYPTVSAGQTVLITFTLLNTGTSAWSDRGGFSFTCTSSNDGKRTSHGWIPICPNSSTLTFGPNVTVPTGLPYTFSFTFATSSLLPGNIYATYWRLAHNGISFGREVSMLVTVTN